MPALALAFAAAAAGCQTADGARPHAGPQGQEQGAQIAAPAADPALNGAWFYEEIEYLEYRFDDGSWEMWFDGNPTARGTFTAEGGKIALTPTHMHSGEQWQDRNERRAFLVQLVGDHTPAESIEAHIEGEFEIVSGTYFVSGDTLTIAFGGSPATTLVRK
jgi:hypothetical protein